MSGIYGADLAQLRALAQQFSSAAERLDANRMTVGNAIQISAWVGPVAVRFRHQWDSDHSRTVQAAAVRLREAAHTLRANADDQEHTSAVGGAGGGGGGGWSAGVPPIAWGLGGSSWSRSAQRAWDGASGLVGSLKLSKTGVTLANKAFIDAYAHAKHITFLTADSRKAIAAATGAGGVLSALAKGAGVMGVGLGAFETTMHFSRGDAGAGIWSLAKTAIAAAAFVPGPIGASAAIVGLGIVGVELVIKHREAIGRAAADVADAAVSAARTVREGAAAVANKASKFFAGVGSSLMSRFGRR